MATLLITGADGFVGRHLCAAALAQGFAVRGSVRRLPSAAGEAGGMPEGGRAGVQWVASGDIGPDTAWGPLLAGVDAVLHLAGRAHQLGASASDPLDSYRRANVAGTQRLAEAALAAGARRFVFASTVLVHGRFTAGEPIGETAPAAPREPYAQTKWEAEAILAGMAAQGLAPVVVRPCLVHGPGVKGNLARLLRWIGRGVPLPLGAVRNARSLVGIANLCDLLLRCATEPAAAGETFIAADDTPISTPQLVRVLAAGMGRPARLLPVPPGPLGAVLRLAGLGRPWEQLAGSLVADAAKARRVFPGWPRVSIEAGLADTGRWYAARATGSTHGAGGGAD